MVAASVPASELESSVRQRLAMPRIDIVWRKRFQRGAENIDDWEIIELNPKPVHALLEEGVWFIAAGGHFTSAAGKLRHKVLPMAGQSVVAPRRGGRPIRSSFAGGSTSRWTGARASGSWACVLRS